MNRLRASVLFSFVTCFLLVTIYPHIALALTDEERAAQGGKRIQQFEQLQRLEDIKRLKALKKKTPIELEQEKLDTKTDIDLCFTINVIELKDVTLLSKAEQQAITKKYTGKCLRLGEINAILNDLTRAYFDKGYIASRVYIPPDQDLSKGRLELLVVEGKLEGFKLQDNANGRSVSFANAFPKMEGMPLNLRDIEQGLDQINRLPSNQATMSIEPGEEIGGSTLVVNNQTRTPFTYIGTMDNLGSESTGRKQLSFLSYIDNPLGVNDSLGLILRHSQPFYSNKSAASATTNYSVPFGYWTASFDGSYSQYVTRIPLTSGRQAKSSGTTLDMALALDRIIFRNRTSRLNGYAKIQRKRIRNYFEGNEIEASSYQLALAEVGVGFNTTLLGGILDTQLGYVQGLDFFDATKDPEDIEDEAPHAQFDKINLGISYLKPFKIGARNDALLSLQATGQYAGSSVLNGVEQISVGGYYTVRGFPDDSISGDNGAYLRSELTLTPGILRNLLGKDDKVDLFVAYDIGKIWGHHGGDEGVMSGTSYGLKIGNNDVSLQLSVTSPLRYPRTIEKPDDFFYASLSFSPKGKREGYVAPDLGENSWFVGLQRGHLDMRLNDVYVAGADYSVKSVRDFSAVSIGKDFGRSKIYATYYDIDQLSDFNFERYDLTFETRLMDTPSIIPFAAITLGYASYEEKNLDGKNPTFVITKNNVSAKDNVLLEGPVYGLSLGLMYQFNNRLSASVSYEYAKMHDKDKIFFDGVEEGFEMDAVRKWMAKIDYKF